MGKTNRRGAAPAAPGRGKKQKVQKGISSGAYRRRFQPVTLLGPFPLPVAQLAGEGEGLGMSEKPSTVPLSFLFRKRSYLALFPGILLECHHDGSPNTGRRDQLASEAAV